METPNKTEVQKKNKNLLTEILKALLVCAVLFFIFNQFHSYYYKEYLLRSPCELCKEFNPHLAVCFKEASTVIHQTNNTYWIWKDKNISLNP